MKIYVTGISGTGKTTISEKLKKMGFYTISIDETDGLCSWVHKETKEKIKRSIELNRDFTSKHQWVCDIDYLEKLINVDENPIFVLGITSNQKDFLNLFDKVLLLQCEPDIFLKRLKVRTNNDYGKDEAIRNHILEWYGGFESKLLKNGAVSIDAGMPINEVVAEVVRQANY